MKVLKVVDKKDLNFMSFYHGSAWIVMINNKPTQLLWRMLSQEVINVFFPLENKIGKIKISDLPEKIELVERKLNGKYLKAWKGDPEYGLVSPYNESIYNAALRKCKKQKISFEHDNQVFNTSKDFRARSFDIKLIVDQCKMNHVYHQDDSNYWPDDIE